MQDNFLPRYFDAFSRIQGWFSPDAALLFMAYAQAARAQGVTGDVLEIGVFHGLSAIALASLRGTNRTLVAIDLFDEHNVPVVNFERNLGAFFDDTSFVRRLAKPSMEITAADLGSEFCFCHVDGGHSAPETFSDLQLCTRVLVPGGLLALDDYFNPSYPGVCEGAIKFWLAHSTELTPLAIGFNKVLFQKRPATGDLNDEFDRLFPFVPYTTTPLWNTTTRLFSAFRPFVDCDASTPLDLVAHREFHLGAELSPQTGSITAGPGERVQLPVRVLNRSNIPFDATSHDTRFGLSYHLLSGEGESLQFDNQRAYFTAPLQPGQARTVAITIDAPGARGRYELEFDIVWEGITWLKNRGIVTPRVTMTVV